MTDNLAQQSEKRREEFGMEKKKIRAQGFVPTKVEAMDQSTYTKIS